MNPASESIRDTWLCPSCGRRVSLSVERCYCSVGLRDHVTNRRPQRPKSRSGEGLRSPLRVAFLGALGAGLGLGVALVALSLTGSALAARTSPSVAAARIDPADAAEPSPPAQASSEAALEPSSQSVPDPNPERAAETPASDAAPPPPATAQRERPLEEVVATVLPGVVSIQTDRGRQGSGFFVEPGKIITNHHVVVGSTRVILKLAGGRSFPAVVKSIDPGKDLALLAADVNAGDYSILALRSASELRPGQEVLAVGTALGILENTVTRGIVSAVRMNGALILVQTDAAINDGNSGGPLVDREGRVVGVNTLKIGPAQSLGFAVAADHAMALLRGGGIPPEQITIVASPTPTPTRRPASRLRPSARNREVDEAAWRFDGAMKRLAPKARELRSASRSFESRCLGDGLLSRSWSGPMMETAKGRALCSEQYEALGRESENLKRAVNEAEAKAREEGVYAPAVRQIKQKYSVGW